MHTLRLPGASLATFFSENYTNIAGGGPVTPGIHNLVVVPKTLALGHVGYCSCGEWKVVGGKNEFASDAASLTAMTNLHNIHKNNTDTG